MPPHYIISINLFIHTYVYEKYTVCYWSIRLWADNTVNMICYKRSHSEEKCFLFYVNWTIDLHVWGFCATGELIVLMGFQGYKLNRVLWRGDSGGRINRIGIVYPRRCSLCVDRRVTTNHSCDWRRRNVHAPVIGRIVVDCDAWIFSWVRRFDGYSGIRVL